ncbi:MAG: nuclear transport factor 2 family protein [Pseudomonadota bacterium]
MGHEAGSALAVLKGFLAEFQSGQWERACKTYCATDFEIHEPPGIPQQGIFRGQFASIEVSNIYRDIWDFAIGEQQFWEAQDEPLVFSRYVLTWTSKATGKSLTQPVVELNHVRNERLVKMEVFMFDPTGLSNTLIPD